MCSKKVWAIGDAAVDLLPDGATHYLKCPGGAAANVAVCVARLGGDCGFIGRLGKDDAGYFLQRVFLCNHVDISYLKLDPQLTSAVLIVNLAVDGERSFTFLVHPAADTFVTPDDLPQFQPSEWLYFSAIGLTDMPSRESCFAGAENMLKAGGYVMFDGNLRENMWRDLNEIPNLFAKAASLASVSKISEYEVCRLAGVSDWRDGRYFMRDRGCDITVISLGEKGAYLICPEGESYFNSYHVKVVDTTGAGDAFVGGLLYCLSQHSSLSHSQLSEAIQYANACGALVVTSKGAMTSLPTRQQLDEFRLSQRLSSAENSLLS